MFLAFLYSLKQMVWTQIMAKEKALQPAMIRLTILEKIFKTVIQCGHLTQFYN